MGFCDENPKIIKKGVNWYYVKTNKKIPKSLKTRVEHLPIPPVYKCYWVSKNKHNDILAVWEDSNGRKQYLYNDNWNSTQKKEKYNRMRRFVKKLDKFWKIVENDLSSRDFKVKMIAYMFRLLNKTYMRVGNLKYYKNNNSIGLTTLRKENVYIERGKLLFKFNGKSNVYHEICITDKKIIKFIKSIMKKETTEWLFTVNGIRINSMDMSNYLKKNMGKEFKVKDFRTVSANTIFINTVKLLDKFNYKNGDNKKTKIKKIIRDSLKITAEKLGHNSSTSKKSYVSEGIVEFYQNNPKRFLRLSTSSILNNFIFYS